MPGPTMIASAFQSTPCKDGCALPDFDRMGLTFGQTESGSVTSSVGAGPYQRFGKRTLDVILAGVLMVTIAPLVLVLMLAVMSDGHGQPLFRHRRVGRNGRVFDCLKLRTMVPDAERRLDALLAQDPIAADEWDRYQKLTQDPRITRLGRFLRASSLDELPQLWNVLRGEMSLVGPRPFTQSEARRFGQSLPMILSMRPGITGMWQISQRNTDKDYAQRVRADITYAQTVTLAGDVAILYRTIGVVLARSGS